MSTSTTTAAATATATASGNKAQPKKKYKFYREDFGALATVPLHLNLHFDVIDQRVIVEADTTFKYNGPSPANQTNSQQKLTELRLNSKNLEVRSVERIHDFEPCDASPASHSSEGFVRHVESFVKSRRTPLKYRIDCDTDMLIIELDESVSNGQQFIVRTVSVAAPTAHILEGLYYDWTPPGRPCRTIITQCQQHGFQRIVPCIDMMAAKAYYTTRLVADSSYTNVITNGDLAMGYYDTKTSLPTPKKEELDKRPSDVPSSIPPRNVFLYYNHKVNMSSYLFFAGFGYYKTYRRECEYATGDKFMLELLVFEGLVKEEHALTAINALHDSVQWIHISTGPEATEHLEEQKMIYQLIDEREKLKQVTSRSVADEQRLTAIRQELKQLISVWKKTGYQYSSQVYREIAMENSDYGGMENVGNTTIISSRLVPSELITDASLVYLEGVKVHEFYHNINGSEVTGQSPFEIWLNEAVTVHIQRQRESVLFGHDFMRLKEVIYSFMPGLGPLAVDRSTNSMSIEPEGFNRSQELVSAMTYSKAPEFVRMIELILGKAQFNKALDHYHTTFKYKNATTKDWIDSMERFNSSHSPIPEMAKRWLKRTGWPTVTYSTSYNADKHEFTVTCEQSGLSADDAEPWIFPIQWSLNKAGKDTHEGVWLINQVKQQFTISNVRSEPDFLSFARGWSFFGQSLHANPRPGQLHLQALNDTDIIGRFFAYRAIADQEKRNVIETLLKGNKDYKVSAEYVTLHAKLLFDELLTGSTRAMIIREAEEITTYPALAHHYWEISHAKHALLQAVFDAHHTEIVKLYDELRGRNQPGPHKAGLHDRALKHHLFSILNSGLNVKSVLSSRSETAIKQSTVNLESVAKQLIASPFMSDQVYGFTQYLQLHIDANKKAECMKQQLDKWKTHPDALESYINCIASSDCPDTVEYISELTANPLFKYELACHARATARAWSINRKRALLTEEGLQLTMKMFERIGKVNQYSAQSFISAFNDLPRFDCKQQQRLVSALQQMRSQLDPKKQESLFNQLNIVLKDFEQPEQAKQTKN